MEAIELKRDGYRVLISRLQGKMLGVIPLVNGEIRFIANSYVDFEDQMLSAIANYRFTTENLKSVAI